GIITKVAGDWTLGYSGDGGPAGSAQLGFPNDIAFDAAGNLYIADMRYVIRRVDAQTGVITTIAGNGVKGIWKDGDTAVKTQLGGLAGICVDQAGNVYFSDGNNRKIGKINTQGILSVYCGTGMWGHSGDGGLAIHATTFASTKIRLDKYGNMFIPDGGTIRKIDQASGIIDRVAGTGAYSFNGDGGPALQASFAGPVSTYFDIFYNLFIADKTNYRIRKISGLTSIEQVPVLSY